MEPEMQQKVTELLELTKENNMMLRSMRRLQRWTSAFKVVYWLVLIGVAAGAFYFLQPYMAQFKSFSSAWQNSDLKGFFDQSQNK